MDKATAKGWIKGLDGRKLPVRHKHAALNTLLQSAGAIICKKWMVELDRLIKENNLDAHQVAWIHDELQFECKADQAELLGELGEKAMKITEEYFNFKCPLTILDTDKGAFASIGASWKETH